MKGYTSQQEIENYLLVEIDESFEPQVERWIEVAETVIDQETGRDFALSGDPETRVFDGDGSDTLEIGAATAVTAVSLYLGSGPIDADQYVLYPANGGTFTRIVLRHLKFPKGTQNISVTGTFGIETLPADIKFAATVLAAAPLTASQNSASDETGEVQSMSIGRYSVTYRSRSPQWAKLQGDLLSVQAILDRNRRYAF
jgi:hypothetical protein